MLCKGCGRSVAEDADICAHCGRQLQTPEECKTDEKPKTPHPRKPKDHWGHKLLWAVPVLLVALVGAVVLLLLQKPPAPAEHTVYLLTGMTEYAYDGTVLGTTTMEYNSDGQLLKAVKPSGSTAADLKQERTVTYTYDGDRITKAHIVDGGESFLLAYSYKDGKLHAVETEKARNSSAYIRGKCDLAGHITRLYYFDGSYVYKKNSYTYHPNGQVATCTVEPPLNAEYKLTYSYDTRGKLTEQTFELQGEVRQRITYTYDQAGRLTLKQEFTDGDSQLPTNTLELTYETNEKGQLKAVHIFRTQGHDAISLSLRGAPKGNRVELKPASAPETVPQDLCITVVWDNAGNILEEKVFLDGGYGYYRTYQYQRKTLPTDYIEPTSLEPRWFIDI